MFYPVATPFVLYSLPLHDGYFFLRQAVEFINQFVDLLIGRVNLALEQSLLMAGFGFRQGISLFAVSGEQGAAAPCSVS